MSRYLYKADRQNNLYGNPIMPQRIIVKFSSNIGKLKEGDWPRWSREVTLALRSQSAWRYIDGTITAPPLTAARQYQEWVETNDQIVGALGTIVDGPLQEDLQTVTLAREAWMMLKRKTLYTGIAAKLQNVQSAMQTRFTPSTPFGVTMSQLRDVFDAIFDSGAPTQDEWFIILLLNALSGGEYDWLCKDAVGFLTHYKMRPTASDVIELIEFKAREYERDKYLTTAVAARPTHPSAPYPDRLTNAVCANCQRQGHTLDMCWENGGAADATPSWWIKSMNTGKRPPKTRRGKRGGKSKAYNWDNSSYLVDQTTTDGGPGTKAFSLLRFGSPLFDELWPTIFDMADKKTQNALHLTNSYFRQMWELADIQRKSDIAKADYARIIAQHPDYPQDHIIPSSPNLWYSWGAYDVGFSLRGNIAEFCAIADVELTSARTFSPGDEEDEDAWVFVSKEKDFTFTTLCNSEGSHPWDTEVLYFGCTGEREKTLKLENYWLAHGKQLRPFKGSRWYSSVTDKVY